MCTPFVRVVLCEAASYSASVCGTAWLWLWRARSYIGGAAEGRNASCTRRLLDEIGQGRGSIGSGAKSIRVAPSAFSENMTWDLGDFDVVEFAFVSSSPAYTLLLPLICNKIGRRSSAERSLV
jgi:hypothetical protein